MPYPADVNSEEEGQNFSFDIFKAEGDVLFKQSDFKKALQSYNTVLLSVFKMFIQVPLLQIVFSFILVYFTCSYMLVFIKGKVAPILSLSPQLVHCTSSIQFSLISFAWI